MRSLQNENWVVFLLQLVHSLNRSTGKYNLSKTEFLIEEHCCLSKYWPNMALTIGPLYNKDAPEMISRQLSSRMNIFFVLQDISTRLAINKIDYVLYKVLAT